MLQHDYARLQSSFRKSILKEKCHISFLDCVEMAHVSSNIRTSVSNSIFSSLFFPIFCILKSLGNHSERFKQKLIWFELIFVKASKRIKGRYKWIIYCWRVEIDFRESKEKCVRIITLGHGPSLGLNQEISGLVTWQSLYRNKGRATPAYIVANHFGGWLTVSRGSLLLHRKGRGASKETMRGNFTAMKTATP